MLKRTTQPEPSPGFIRVNGKLVVKPTWITPESRAHRAATIEAVQRGTMGHCFPAGDAAGPPDLRPAIVKLATRVAASGQAVIGGELSR